MNTPAHMIASAVAFRTYRRPEWFWPAIAGAVVPDAPMFVFYAYQKLIARQAESLIWSDLYFRPDWQLFFDLLNSVPICLFLLAIALRFRRRGWAVFFGSILLHAACDLPLHHDDAHGHFWPISDWHFASPVSYWDFNHFGWIVAPLEAAMAMFGSLVLMRDRCNRRNRVLGALVLAIYSLVLVFFAVFLARRYLFSERVFKFD